MDQAAIHRRRWWTLAVLSLSLLMIGLDATILNVALPPLVRDLDATVAELQWILDAYVLVLAGMLLTAGSLGDRLGRKRLLQVGLVVFGAGSALSAFSGSAGMLVASRALMGLGSACVMPATLSITANVFSGQERTKAIGVWAGVVGIGLAVGPIAGGWLLDHFWWGSVFLVNLPVVALALAAGVALVPDSRDPAAGRPDPLGTALSVVGLTALLYGIIEAPARGWTGPAVLAAFAAAGLALGAFAVWELRSDHPMLEIRLFRNPRFSAASACLTLVFFALFGSLFFVTQHLQFVLGFTALEAGIRTVPLAVGLSLGAPASARLVNRFGSRRVVAAGMTVAAGGLAVLALATPASGYGLVLAALLLQGLGMGVSMTPVTDSIMASLPPAKAGVGSAMNDTTRQAGGALGVAVLGTVLSSAYRAGMADHLAGLPASAAAVARDSVGGAVAVAARVGGEPGQALAAAAGAAFVDAMNLTVLVAAAVILAGVVVALRFLPDAERPASEPAGAGPADAAHELDPARA
jgi:EmrB/QacA subfamily drug resistance transporter